MVGGVLDLRPMSKPVLMGVRQSLAAPDGRHYAITWSYDGSVLSWMLDGVPQDGLLPDSLYETAPGPAYPKKAETQP